MAELQPDGFNFNIEDNIGYLMLNNPPSNMMNKSMSRKLSHLLEQIEPHSLKGIIVHGSGRHFCAGVVLEELEKSLIGSEVTSTSKTKRSNFTSIDSLSFQKLAEFPIPVIAAIRGVCIGSGFELALSCHYRICDKNTIMGLVESSFGLMPGCGGTIRLPRITGLPIGLEMILTGKRIDAEEARKLKIVNEVVHHSELLKTAVYYVNKLNPFYKAKYEYIGV